VARICGRTDHAQLLQKLLPAIHRFPLQWYQILNGLKVWLLKNLLVKLSKHALLIYQHFAYNHFLRLK
jgi:hypothetical protein